MQKKHLENTNFMDGNKILFLLKQFCKNEEIEKNI